MCMLNSRGPTSWIACTTSVPARTVWPTSMQQPMRGSIPFTALQHIERRMPQLVFRPVIVNRDADVVLLHELLDPRQSLGRGIAGHNHWNARSLAVFELAADVGIFVFGESKWRPQRAA